MLIPPGYANVVLSGVTLGSSRPWATSCGFAIAAFGEADLEDLQSYIGSSDYVDNASEDCGFRGVDVVVGTSDPSAPIHITAGLEFNGSGGTGGFPNSAYLLRKSTLLGGRKGKGRSFMPGVTEASIGQGGTVLAGDGSLAAGLESFWMDVPASVEALDGPYLLHSDETAPTLIQGMSLDGTLATQRRRLRK